MSNSEELRSKAPVAPDECGLARASDLLGDKWVLLILRQLFYGVGRFADISAELSVPKSVLSTRLAGLIDAGLVEKRPYKQDGARTRHSYHLSPAGRDLAMTFLALLEWGNQHFPTDGTYMEAVRKSDKGRLRLGLIHEESGDEVPLNEVWLSRRQT